MELEFEEVDTPVGIKDALLLNDISTFCPLYQKFGITDGRIPRMHQKVCAFTESAPDIVRSCDSYQVTVDVSGEKLEMTMFVKCSLLFDTVKFMANPRDVSFGCMEAEIANNSSYVDGFFSYLSSCLLHGHNFVNAIDCAGLYMGQHSRIVLNMIDDEEYLDDHYFRSNSRYAILAMDDEKQTRPPLKITDAEVKLDEDVLKAETMNEDASECASSSIGSLQEIKCEIPSDSRRSSKSSHSSCSSRTSNTRTNESQSDDDSDSDNSGGLSDSEYSGSSHESDVFEVEFYDVPSFIVVMEKCDDTLEHVLNSGAPDEEISAILMQVIFTIAAYQRVYKFTHNDLHCNNIMYVRTDRENLYYQYNGQKYKVPTHGKIFKVIDFDRAIYQYKGVPLMGDCYRQGDVASNQYNWGEYYDTNRREIPPNESFDMCRFGCSLFDMLIDPDDDVNDLKTPLKRFIARLCLDDGGKSILYKSNEMERYPDFKLYKMIARKVHSCKPVDLVDNPLFDRFRARTKLPRKARVMNIDTLPVMY